MHFELCRASAAERRQTLPGDPLVPQPMGVITHAITIDAPPRAVWPWLVQMGSGRGGWYAFDHIDNGGAPSARHVIPELQQIQPGDLMPWLPGATDGFLVQGATPERALILVVPRQPRSMEIAEEPSAGSWNVLATWALALEPTADGRTRLISRSRVADDFLTKAPSRAPRRLLSTERIYDLLARLPHSLMLPAAGAGHYLMESRMLRGVKRRAEQAWRAAQPEAALIEREGAYP
ncbi:MAG TPA: hypothetical protein VFU72_13985 [Nitrolancea sp.]|nr:hypothetical protein [Nitrolancea sp.]